MSTSLFFLPVHKFEPEWVYFDKMTHYSVKLAAQSVMANCKVLRLCGKHPFCLSLVASPWIANVNRVLSTSERVGIAGTARST